MGPRLALGAAVALGVWLIWAPSSDAFHNSQLDLPTKQFLAGLIDQLQDQCNNSDTQACRRKEEIRALGNNLARAEQGCATRNQRACQERATLRAEVASLTAQGGGRGGQSARTAAPQEEPPPAPRTEGSVPRPGASGTPGTSTKGCTAEQVLALLDRGFSKADVQQLCAGGRAPGGTETEQGDRPKRPPAEAGRPGTPDSENPLPDLDIDWSPLKTYFEISQVDFGIEGQVTSLGKVLSESQITFIAEAKRSFHWTAPPHWVRLYDADSIEVESRLLTCKPHLLRDVKRGERLRCSFGFTPSTHPTVKKIIFAKDSHGPSGGSPRSRSSGPNESGGGLGAGEDVPERRGGGGRSCFDGCNRYSRQEASCTTLIPDGGNAYNGTGDNRMEEREACRREASQAFNDCLRQCQQR